MRLATVAGLLFLILATSTPAAEGGGEQTISRRAYDVLTAAQDLIAKDQHRQAAEKLRALLPEVDGNAYEAALAWQMLGYALSSAGDHPAAADAFRQALQRQALPADAAHDLTLNVAQLLIHGEQYKEGLRYLEEWFKSEKNPSRDAHVLAAVGYFRSGNCAGAIPHARLLVEDRKQQEEQWYHVLAACHYELKQYNEVAQVLEQSIRYFPAKSEYWLQLAAVYQQIDQDRKATALMALAAQRGILSSTDVVNLARMYLAIDVPYKAAEWLQAKLADGTLERNREHLELLADSWQLAQERTKAIEVLAELARSSADGETSFRLGRLYFETEQWLAAVESLRAALKAGGVKDPSLAHLLLGIAAVRVNNPAVAEQSLNQALRSPGTHDQAMWWLRQLRESAAPQTPEEEQQS